MYVDTSPSETVPPAATLPRMNGLARVGFERRDGATRLAALDQRMPLRVLFPQPEQGEPPLAAMVTTSGGLVGGDFLEIAVTVGEGARAVAIGQAAEKVYRSTGPDSVVEVALTVGSHGWLEWLPQETILFDGARLNRRTAADVGAAGRLLAGECLVFGRLARGEVMRYGLARERWEVRRAGRLVWADTFHAEDDIFRILETPAGLAGARAYATAVYVGDDAADYLALARETTGGAAEVRAGATCVNGVLVARWLGVDPLFVRRGFERYWMALRGAAGSLPSRLPRLWHV